MYASKIEFALKRIANSRLHTIMCQSVQRMSEPAVVSIASKEVFK